MEKKYSFFSNKECEYFPCHPWKEGKDFNCLFCYCPLYALGGDCGGNYKMTEDGIKDCSDCLLPHRRENYDYIVSRYCDIVKKLAET